MRSNLQIASHLLTVDNRKGSLEQKKIRAHPALFAFLNLLFCSYMDQFLRNDVDKHYLGLFFFIECSMLVLIVIGSFITSTDEILKKALIFPTTSWSRLLFVFFSSFRKPASIAIWLTTAFFLIIFFHESLLLAGGTLLFFALLVIVLMMFTSVLCVKLSTSSQPIVGLAVIGIVFMIVVLVSSLLFHMTSLLTSMPFLLWAIRGIGAAQERNISVMIMNLVYMIVAGTAVTFFGKRYL